MGKKKKRKSSGSFFSGVVNFFQGTVLLAAKTLPLLLMIGLGGGIFFGVRQALYADSGLTVQRINVVPAQGISVIQRERLESQYLGKNILKVNLSQIKAALEKDPVIQSASVARTIPAEITVRVTKRNPVAFIKFGNQMKYGVISQDGMMLDTVDEKAATGLIVEVPSASGGGLPIGQFYKNRAFQEAVRFLELYQHLPMSQEEPVTKVILDHLGNVSVYLKGGPEVRLGRRPSLRLEVFKKIGPLLESEMRKKIDYLDLQFDDVVVKQKKGVK